MNVSFKFHRDIIFLVSLILLASFFTSLPQTLNLWNGIVIPAHMNPGLRFIREIILLLIMVYMLFWVKQLKIPKKSTTLLFVFIAVYSLSLFFKMINLNYPMMIPISGLRIFQYIPVAYAMYIIGLMNKRKSFEAFIKFLKLYVFIQVTIGIFQIFTAVPVYGTNIFGTRAFGTMPSPNVFGFIMATCGLLFYYSEKKNTFWILLCFLAAFASGSRAAFLGAFIVIGFVLLKKFSVKLRILVTPICFLLLFAFYKISRSQAVSGRVIRDEGRLSVWDSIISNMDSASEFLFGWGLGLGSNTVNTLYGYGAFSNQFVSDSTYVYILSSFGIVGLIIYLILLLSPLKFNKVTDPLPFVVFVGFYSVPFVAWETFPSNLLMLFLWGWLAGQNKYFNEKETQV